MDDCSQGTIVCLQLGIHLHWARNKIKATEALKFRQEVLPFWPGKPRGRWHGHRWVHRIVHARDGAQTMQSAGAWCTAARYHSKRKVVRRNQKNKTSTATTFLWRKSTTSASGGCAQWRALSTDDPATKAASACGDAQSCWMAGSCPGSASSITLVVTL